MKKIDKRIGYQPTNTWRPTTMQQLNDETRRAIGQAIMHEREEELIELLHAYNADPNLPLPGADLFTAARLVLTEVYGQGVRDVTEMLQAIEEGDDVKFASFGAAFFGRDSDLGNVLAAFAFPADDEHDDDWPEVLARYQETVRALAAKWGVALAPEVSP